MGKELLGVFCLCTTKMLCTYISQILGGLREVHRDLASKSSINRLAHYRVYARSHSSTLYRFVTLTLKCKEGTFKTEIKESGYVLDRKGVLLWSTVSCCNLLWMMSRVGSTGIDVNRAFTSYEEMHSLCCNRMDLACSTKCCVFLIWWG